MNFAHVSVSLLTGLMLLCQAPAHSAPNRSNDYCSKASGVNLVDTSKQVTADFLAEMKKVGVDTVVRYYDYENETLPGKRLREAELPLIRESDLKLMVIFQHNNDKRETFLNWKQRGPGDALEALALAERMKQPKESAIYFGVDKDLVGTAIGYDYVTDEVVSYFEEINRVFKERDAGFSIGIYGSGAACNAILGRGLAQYCWLSHSHGFTGTSAALARGNYHIEQFLEGHCGGRDVDFSKRKNGVSDVGQFALD